MRITIQFIQNIKMTTCSDLGGCGLGNFKLAGVLLINWELNDDTILVGTVPLISDYFRKDRVNISQFQVKLINAPDTFKTGTEVYIRSSLQRIKVDYDVWTTITPDLDFQYEIVNTSGDTFIINRREATGRQIRLEVRYR